jgi:cytochrome c biogenesis protein CcdA
MAAPRQGLAERSAVTLGAGIMAVELPTALPYFAAIAAIVASHLHLAIQIALLVLYNVAFVAPLLALLAARQLAGERAVARLDGIGRWLRERGAMLLAGLFALCGVVVGAVGIAGLV